jgi:serine/threonine protein kinase
VIVCSFAKICSLLGMGPKMKLDTGFDLVCSRTRIEFYMKWCEQTEYRPKDVTVEIIKKRLRYCVAVLHKHRLIYKDIKLSNILYN